jgi:hypothetical protein
MDSAQKTHFCELAARLRNQGADRPQTKMKSKAQDGTTNRDATYSIVSFSHIFSELQDGSREFIQKSTDCAQCFQLFMHKY